MEMAFINQETKNKLEAIAKNMRNYAVLVDEPTKKGDVGMGMPTEAKIFRENADDVQNGVFKVLVMGKFKNGKSTFINALVGKVMMAARATACTAVIATVEYGNDTDNVKVVYSDSPDSKKMTLRQFTDEFALSEEDQQYIEDGGRLDRFANVSHVEMQSRDEIFADGVRLIDSPGLEEATARTRATNEFVPKANAIIFTLSATSLFSSAEKEYIAANFAGKSMRNVFFVVNRIDNLTEGQLEASVMPSVRMGLADVFTDQNGRFDDVLYSKRVFFTNAYGALCARTGEQYKIILGKKEVPVDIDIEDTGMLEFENSLREFLNSPDRINATFNSTLQNMANTYQLASRSVEAAKIVRSQSKEERQINAAKAQKRLDEAMQDVEHIKSVVRTSATTIANKTYLDLLSFVQNDIPREFAAIASGEAKRVKFGMGQMLKLATANLFRKSEKIEEVYQPFLESVQNYTKSQLQNWNDRVPTVIDQDIQDMEAELDTKISDFASNLVAAENMFTYGTEKGAGHGNDEGLKTGIQNIIAFVGNRDYSFMIENTAKGGTDWMTFAKRFAAQAGIDIALAVLTGGLFIPLKLFLEVVSTGYRANRMANDIIINLGNEAFAGLLANIKEREVEFKEQIISEFDNRGIEIAAAASGLANDYQKSMDKLLNENKMSDAEMKAENERADSTLAQMRDCIDAIHKELYGHTPTEEEFLKLARNEKKK